MSPEILGNPDEWEEITNSFMRVSLAIVNARERLMEDFLLKIEAQFIFDNLGNPAANPTAKQLATLESKKLEGLSALSKNESEYSTMFAASEFGDIQVRDPYMIFGENSFVHVRQTESPTNVFTVDRVVRRTEPVGYMTSAYTAQDGVIKKADIPTKNEPLSTPGEVKDILGDSGAIWEPMHLFDAFIFTRIHRQIGRQLLREVYHLKGIEG